jgi:FAD synthase
MTKEIYLTNINNKNVIRLMMEDSEYDQFQKIADAMEMPKTTFQSTLSRDSLKLRDFQRIAEILGYQIILEKK